MCMFNIWDCISYNKAVSKSYSICLHNLKSMCKHIHSVDTCINRRINNNFLRKLVIPEEKPCLWRMYFTPWNTLLSFSRAPKKNLLLQSTERGGAPGTSLCPCFRIPIGSCFVMQVTLLTPCSSLLRTRQWDLKSICRGEIETSCGVCPGVVRQPSPEAGNKGPATVTSQELWVLCADLSVLESKVWCI